jgi:hypothetical protein
MQESNKKADESLYPSGNTGIPVEDSLAQDGLAKKVKKRTSAKSAYRKARKSEVKSETLDSTKFRRALVRSINESNKKGKTTRPSRDPSHSGSLRRVGFRSVGILSIIICTILVTSAYASLGPAIVNDDLTNAVNEVLSFTKNQYMQYRIQVARDHSPPIISGLNDLVIEATGTLTKVTLGRPTVTDNVDPTPTVINNASSAGYPLGTNGVIWKARDDAGNIATALQKVTIVDTAPPIVTAPADLVVEIVSSSYSTQLSLGTAIANDAVDSSPFVTNDGPIGGFPEGMTVVTWTATDVSGNSAQDTQLVSIVVVQHALEPGTSNTGSSTESSTQNTNSTTDIGSAPPGTSSSVSYSFGGGGGSGSKSNTITDSTPPTIIPPPFIIANATDPLTLVVLGSPTVSDTADPTPAVSNDAPIDGFPLGTTIVTWKATDASGNFATAAQLVTILTSPIPDIDINPPEITAPSDIIAPATTTLTIVTLDTPIVSDIEDPSPVVTNNAPLNGFPIGTTIVTWTATDSSGNSATAEQRVTVVLDIIGPLVESDVEEGSQLLGDSSVLLDASDNSGGSGIGQNENSGIYYKFDQAQNYTFVNSPSLSVPLISLNDGIHRIQYFGMDNVGNEGDETSISFLYISDPHKFVSQLVGVNYMNRILLQTEAGPKPHLLDAPPSNVSLTQIHDHGFNLVRVPFYWEAYNIDREGTLAEMDSIASTAQQVGIYVVFDFHQYHTSSYFYDSPWKDGFPSLVVNKYSSEEEFWNAFYNNTVNVDGISAWQLSADVLKAVAGRVDKHSSVLGYEILNEPPLYDNSQYEKLGNYHTFIVEQLRSYGTSKYILFDRAYPQWNTAYVDMTYYHKIAPSNTEKTIFAPHRYSVFYSVMFDKYRQLAHDWGDLPVILGEWALSNQGDINNLVMELKRVEFGWTYWAWQPGKSTDYQCLLDYDFQPSVYLEYVKHAHEKYYS